MNQAAKIWRQQAATELINGALNAMLQAGTSGIAVGAGSFKMLSLAWSEAVLCAVVIAAVNVVTNALKYFAVWFKDNPFPNPYTKP